MLQKDSYLPVYYKLIVQFLTSIVPYLLLEWCYLKRAGIWAKKMFFVCVERMLSVQI